MLETVNFKNCVFNASDPVEGKAAIEIDSSLNPVGLVNIENCTATGFGTGSNSGNSLYNLKKGTLGVDCNINVVQSVTTAEELTLVTQNAAAQTTIYLANAIDGDVSLAAKTADIIINGNGYKFDGKITMTNGNGNDLEKVGAVTLQNIAFESSTVVDEFIYTDDKQSDMRNMKILNCSFKCTGTNVVVALRSRQDVNVTVENCTAEGLHSLVQSTSNRGLTIKNVTAKCNEGGVNLNTSSSDAVIESCQFEITSTGGYGIRADADAEAKVTVTGCEISAFVPIYIRRATGVLDLTLSGTNKFTPNNVEGYQIVVNNEKDWDENNTLVTPTGTITITGADGMKVYK